MGDPFPENRDKILAKVREYQRRNPDRKRAYPPRDPAKAKATQQRWYRRNRDRILAEDREYHRLNRDKILARKKEWYYRNHDKALASTRAYKRRNRDKVNAYLREYRRRICFQKLGIDVHPPPSKTET